MSLAVATMRTGKGVSGLGFEQSSKADSRRLHTTERRSESDFDLTSVEIIVNALC
jgi:hypothetical protein